MIITRLNNGDYTNHCKNITLDGLDLDANCRNNLTVSIAGVSTGITATANLTQTEIDDAEDAFQDAKQGILQEIQDKIGVNYHQISSISLNKSATTLMIDRKEALTARIDPGSGVYNKNIIWYSGNSAVASVNASTSVVTGKSVGTAIITAITEDGRKTASCTVTVYDAFASANRYQETNANIVYSSGWSSISQKSLVTGNR